MTKPGKNSVVFEVDSSGTSKKPYVSPYTQSLNRGIIKRKPDKSPMLIAKTQKIDSSNKISNKGIDVQRHRTVDELMKRISDKQAQTLCIPDSRLRDVEIEKHHQKQKTRIKESSSAFLTLGPDGDELSVGSGVLSAGSFGTFGSYGSLKSAISVCESQISKGGKKIKTFEVDIKTKQGGLIRQKRSLQSLINDIESSAKEKNLPPLFVPQFDEMPDTMLSWNGKNNLKPSKKMLEKQKRKQERARLLKMANQAADRSHVGVVESSKYKHMPENSAGRVYEGDDDELTIDDDMGSVGSSVGFRDTSTVGMGDSSSKKKPHIDIIGMYQTVPLILARADERCRKREAAVALKNKANEEKRQALMELIRYKMTRPERYAEELRRKQLCIAWLKLIPALIYNTTYSKVCPKICEIQKRNKEEFWAIMVLTRVVRRFINYKIEKKIRSEFLAKLQTSFWILGMAVRAKRKRFAVRKIRYLFSLFEGKNRIKYVVHRFVQSAHMIQRAIRNFILCTRSRIDTLMTIWNEVECNYILEILERRQKEQGSLLAGLDGGKDGGDDNLISRIDGKLKIEIQKQADRWKESQAKMDALLQKHRKAGLIDKVNLREVAQKMILDIPEKRYIISDYIRARRRIFISEKDESARKIMKESQTFAVADATDLLQGNTERINNTVRVRMNMIRRYGSTSFGMPLFDEHNTMHQVKDIFRKHIETLHKKAGTFVVKSSTKMKRKIRRKPSEGLR